MNTTIPASDLQVGDILPQRSGTGTVRGIIARTAKTITVLVEYDEDARRTNGNQEKRANRHSLTTSIEVTR